MRNHNRHQSPQYKQLVTTARPTAQPALCSYRHPTLQHVNSPFKAEKAIDDLPILISPVRSTYLRDQIIRNKSVEITRNRLTDGPYRGLISELSDNNDRTLEQLGDDLKRIKNCIGKVEGELGRLGREEQEGEAMHEEVKLLEEENQRLRQKNMELLEEKRKLASKIQHYQEFYERHRAKKQDIVQIHIQQKQLKQKGLEFQLLRRKQQQYEYIKRQNEELQAKKNDVDRRLVSEIREKNNLIYRIRELQQQKQLQRKKWEDILDHELSKKDSYYKNIMYLQQKEREDRVQLTINNQQQLQLCLKELHQQLQDRQRHLKRIDDELDKTKKQQKNLKDQNLSLQQCIRQKVILYEGKVEILNNQIEHLNFAYQQLKQHMQSKQLELSSLKKAYQYIKQSLQQQKIKGESQSIRYEQEHNRYILLQQLYNRIQKQAKQNSFITQNHISNYKIALQQQSEQINHLRKQLCQVSEESEKCIKQIEELTQKIQQQRRQLGKKEEQIMILKQQCYILKKNNVPPSNISREQRIFMSPRKQEIKEKINSRYFKPDIQLQFIQNTNKFQGFEKEINDLMKDYRSELRKEKTLFRSKEKRLKQVIESQKSRIDELGKKLVEAKKQMEKNVKDKLGKQEELMRLMCLKEEHNNQYQMKYYQLAQQKYRLEISNRQLTTKLEYIQIQFKKSQQNIVEIKAKTDVYKKSIIEIFRNILRQVKNLGNLNDDQSLNCQNWMDFNQLNIGDMNIFTDLNFALRKVHQIICNFSRKNKRLQEEGKNNGLIWLQNWKQHQMNPSHQVNVIRNRFNEENYKIEEEEQIKRKNNIHIMMKKEVQEKENELQSKLEIKTIQLSKLNLEYISALQEIKNLERKNTRLKEQIITLETESNQINLKLRQYVQELRRLKQKQQDSCLYKYITPRKQRQETHVEEESELRSVTLRQRVKSAKHYSPDRWQSEFSDSTKLIDLQMMNVALTRNLDQAISEINYFKAKMSELDVAYKTVKEKNMKEMQVLREQNERINKRLQQQDLLIIRLEREVGVLVEELQEKKQQQNSLWEQLIQVRQEIKCSQTKILEISVEKQKIERLFSQKLMSKQINLQNLLQKHQIRNKQLTMELAQVKEKLQVEYNRKKNEDRIIVEERQKLKNNLNQSKGQTKDLKIRLDEMKIQHKQEIDKIMKQCERLAELLEDREIELQELKFIRQSTMINMEGTTVSHLGGNQQVRPHKDSIYSFTHE